MFTAEEARKLVTEQNNRDNVAVVLLRIRDAAQRGERSVKVEAFLMTPETVRRLRADPLKYDVRHLIPTLTERSQAAWNLYDKPKEDLWRISW